MPGVLESQRHAPFREESASVVEPEVRRFSSEFHAVASIGLRDIQRTVVVEVHRQSSPADAAIVHSRELCPLVVTVVARVQVEFIAREMGDLAVGIVQVVDRGDVPVQEAVPIEFSDRLSHALLILPRSGFEGTIAERAVTVVQEIFATPEIRHEEQLGVAVSIHVDEVG